MTGRLGMPTGSALATGHLSPASLSCDVSMKPGLYTLLVAISLVAPGTSAAQNPHYANGLPVKGEPTEAITDGLVVQIGQTTKTIPWSNLSPATRYRYEIFFRANVRQVAAGVPSADWSNQPDEGYWPFSTAVKSNEADAVDASADNGLRVDLESYEDVDPITPIDIPRLEIRSMDVAQFWRLQYGPTRKDVASLAFDAKGPGEFHDVMFAHIVADGRTDKVKGAKRVDKTDNYMEFRKIQFQSLFDATKATFDLSCMFAGKSGSTLLLTADVEFSRDAANSTFTLTGRPAGIAQGNGQILCRPLLIPPTLWFVLDTSSGKPQLVGNIRMSRLKLIPGKGMDSKVKVTVMNSANEIALEEDISPSSTDADTKHTIICDLSKVAQDETYTVKASINLGPFLGTASFEDRITVPTWGEK
ncbi:MAG: hypothetical protein V1929_12980 [bacterium]